MQKIKALTLCVLDTHTTSVLESAQLKVKKLMWNFQGGKNIKFGSR